MALVATIPMPVVAVINRKGGSGKSTLATQLAGCLANRGSQVMLGDVDRQQSSLAWLRRRAADAQTSMAPVVGPRTPAHLDEYLSALEVELGEQHYQRLTEVSAIALGVPHEDVASALSHGIDGNRRLLDPPHVTVL